MSTGRSWPSWAGSRSSTTWGGCSSPPDGFDDDARFCANVSPQRESPSGGFREHIGSTEHTATGSHGAASSHQRPGEARAARQVGRQLVHLDRRVVAGELLFVAGSNWAFFLGLGATQFSDAFGK